jgi:hypothetical protein
VNYIPNFKSLAHTVPEILLNYTKNRQKSGKMPPTVALILTKDSCRILVIFDIYIPNFKSLALTVLEIFCLQTEGQTHGPMAETLDLGSRHLRTCFGTKN